MSINKKKYEKVGLILREYRKKIGITQKELAERINLSEASIKKFEYGEILPKLEYIFRLSSILNFKLNDLFVLLEPYTEDYPSLTSLFFEKDTDFINYLTSIGIHISGLSNTTDTDPTTNVTIGKPTSNRGIYNYESSPTMQIKVTDFEKIEKETSNYIRTLFQLLTEKKGN
ncbi:helix-turn-helix transcriptional regulator [Sinanaerobacter sp. ZZT-01]|uniref:helix-turn-helix transcriptional regulator n=1 Tax=Sinanaerobacter sp. ZZT-01 TaxID=3111540 RepID=UPI002D77A159|nr:helix-turn-helix transcriptional regulator [Sinanaerobacter sp. ZZT-01]WRR92471.1 helix-turn-helix transcriptional regulator [Sinanaerobacter sp. ZZT-01]